MKNHPLLILCVCVIVAGCSSPVPANKISIVAPSGKYEITTPKNVDITKFQATVNSNGTCSVTFDRWTSTNDPNVIDKATAGRVAEIQAMGNIAATVAEKAIQGAVQGAK